MIIDAHCDSATKQTIEQLQGNREFQLDFPRLAAQVDLQFFAFFLEAAKHQNLTEKMLAKIQDFYSAAERFGSLQVVTRREHLADLGQQEQTFALLSLEGADALADDLTLLDDFYHAGVRALGLTWNNDNYYAGGCAANNRGLSPAGFELLEKAQALGILIDLAHASQQTFSDVAAQVKVPFAVTHTCCAAVHSFRNRNLTDRQLAQVGQAGGVVGITFVPDFLAAENANQERIIEHLRHVIKHAGWQAAALGSDFDGTELPSDISGVESYSELAQRIDAAFNGRETDAILGGNWYRLLSDVLPK